MRLFCAGLGTDRHPLGLGRARTHPAEHAVRGLHSATLTERVPDHTVALLTKLLNMSGDEPAGADRARFTMAGAEPGVSLDITASSGQQGLQAGGTVHHIAFRAPDRDTQERWRHELVAAGLRVTPILPVLPPRKAISGLRERPWKGDAASLRTPHGATRKVGRSWGASTDHAVCCARRRLT